MPLADIEKLLSSLNASDVGRELARGLAVAPSTGAARTDTTGVADFEWNVYIDGSTIVLQIFDFDNQAWRTVTLS